ncbi:MAG: peptidoglycan-binding domain-containing protein [Cyanobium sp. MAG06]|nr:peptidoglycan-binding domain-containing protein [Cyanobium sp. MAG06]
MINLLKIIAGMLLVFVLTMLSFAGIASSVTGQDNPLFDILYKVNNYSASNRVAQNNIVNIGGSGTYSNTILNNTNNTTGDKASDYGITDEDIGRFINTYDENGNIKGDVNYNPINTNNSTTKTVIVKGGDIVSDKVNGEDIVLGNNVDGFPCTVLLNFMRFGSLNQEVRALQIFLFTRGYMSALPNGHFGPSTIEAVKKYQEDNSIDVRGYVGPNTRAQIARDTCGEYKPAIDTAYKGIVYVVAPVIRKAPVKQAQVIEEDLTNVVTKESNNEEIITTTTKSSNLDDLSGLFIKNTNTNTNNTLNSITNSNDNIKSFGGTKSTDYVLINYNVGNNDKPKICVDPGNNGICNDNSNFENLREISVGDSYDATFDKSTNK